MSDAAKYKGPLGYLIHEVGRLMRRRFEEEARIHGITLPQWRTLAQIAQNENVTQAAIAAQIDANPMTVSGILDRLEKRGLIDRFADPGDSRAKRARLTPEGTKLFNTARSVGLAMYDSALEGVNQADRDTVIAVLSKMRTNLVGQTAEQKETV